MDQVEIGPLLRGVLDAQEADEAALSFPSIEKYADRLRDLTQQLGGPIVWPVGSTAERLAGAAVLLSQGEIAVRGPGTNVRGVEVLVVALHAVTPLPVLDACRHARMFGAIQVFACGIEIGQIEAGSHGVEYFQLH